MGYAIGTLTKGVGDDCHYQILEVIETLANANGWTTLRFVDTGSDRELILQGEGLSEEEQIFIGFKCYQNSGLDYYNINCGVFTGYLSGNTFETQPGGYFSAIAAHNNAITYFITCNAQRIVGTLKVGTPVYESFYLGRIFPYARPSEFPYPVYCGGSFNGAAATRFSDLNHSFPFAGAHYNSNSRGRLRTLNGTWDAHYSYPYCNKNSFAYNLAGNQMLVPAGNYFQIEPIILQEAVAGILPSNVWGELDGVYFCTGFNNAVENVLQIGGSEVVDQTGMSILDAADEIISVGGRAFIMIQDVYRTAWINHACLEMK
jgi:hypothetical protein